MNKDTNLDLDINMDMEQKARTLKLTKTWTDLFKDIKSMIDEAPI